MLAKSTATTIIAIVALFSIAAASPVGGSETHGGPSGNAGVSVNDWYDIADSLNDGKGDDERGVKRGRSETHGAPSGNAGVSVNDWYDIADSLNDGGNDARRVKKGRQEPDAWEGGDMMPRAANPISDRDWKDAAYAVTGEGPIGLRNERSAYYAKPNNGQTEPANVIDDYVDENPYSQAYAENVLFQGKPLIDENEPLPPSS